MSGAERDYGHADADWVRTLADNLYQSGLELFFDEWDIVPGDVLGAVAFGKTPAAAHQSDPDCGRV